MMLTLVWDVDDVLNNLMYEWFHHGWRAEHANCRISYTDLTRNPPHDVLGINRDEYLSSMDLFRKTERACNLVPNPEIIAWLRTEGHRFRHVALTARPLDTAPEVAHWVMRHFGAWIRCFGVVPSRMEENIPMYDRSKGEYLAWLGRGDVLVDDSTENLDAAEALGLKILHVAQPWNSSSLSVSELLRKLTEMAGKS